MARTPDPLPSVTSVLAKLARVAVSEERLRRAFSLAFGARRDENRELLQEARRTQLRAVRELKKAISVAEKTLARRKTVLTRKNGPAGIFTMVKTPHPIDRILAEIGQLAEKLDQRVVGAFDEKSFLDMARRDHSFADDDFAAVANWLRMRVKRDGDELTFRELGVLLVQWPPPRGTWGAQFRLPQDASPAEIRSAVNRAEEWGKKQVKRARARGDLSPVDPWAQAMPSTPPRRTQQISTKRRNRGDS